MINGQRYWGFLWAVLLIGLLPIKATEFADWDPITQIQKDNFYIYIVFGQSNAEGFAAQPLDVDKIPNPNLKNLISYDNYENEDATGNNDSHLGEWESVSEPNCRKSKRFRTAFSWVKSFGEEMLIRNPGKKFGFVHVAVASAGIRLFDKDQYMAYMDGTQTNPAPDANARKKATYAYAGNPYQRIIDMAKIAQQYGTIKGILMHQGEADGWKSFWPSEVKKVYRDILKDLSLNSADVPLIFGEPTMGNGPIANQDAIVTEGNIYYIPNCYKVKALDLPYIQNNKLHFTREGYIELGKRYAEKATERLISTGIENLTTLSPFSRDQVNVTIKDINNGYFEVHSSLPLVKINIYTLDGHCLESRNIVLQADVRINIPYNRDMLIIEFLAVNKTKSVLKIF